MADQNEPDSANPSSGQPFLPGVELKSVGPLGVPLPDVFPDQSSVDNQPIDTAIDHGASDAAASSEVSDGTDALEEAVEFGENYIDRVEEAIEHEDCDICVSILQSLRTEPIGRQVQGVRELRQMKAAADAGADPAEIAEMMEDFDVISDVQEHL